jgi:3-dehydroquinate synthase
MPAIRLDVASARSTYPVVIGSGVVRQLPTLLAAQDLQGQRLVVSCPPVWRAHGQRFARLLRRGARPTLMGDGERAKTLATVSRLYDACLRHGLDRSASIVAIGGGVVGDAAGFAAATYLRGIRLVQVPTTLLAQVDSAIGGKVGVNLPSGKNLVGAFHSPDLVVCDPDLLRTLPRREFRAGLYEVVKYGVIASVDLFDRVQERLAGIFGHEADVVTSVVADCCRIKADVVMRDEREMGPRRALNFGHTVGHALEAITGYGRFRHGEAIGHGMRAAARLSVLRGTMTETDEGRLGRLLDDMGPLPAVSDLRIADALDVIARDKKVLNGRLHFVLAKGIGATTTAADVHTRELRLAMRAIGMRA